VTSYSGTTLVVDVFGFAGSGTKTSWKINIGGAKTVDGVLGISQGGTGATTQAAAQTALFPGIDDNANATAITIDASENVGIGTASPRSVLDVINTSGEAAVLVDSRATDNEVSRLSLLTKTAGANTGGVLQHSGGVLSLSNATNLATKHVTIDSSGNVGIGTDGPLANLDVSSSTSPPAIYIANRESKSWTSGMELGRLSYYVGDPSGGGARDAGGMRAYNSAAAAGPNCNLGFWTSSTYATPVQAMTINSAGNVGINQSSPAVKLQVKTATATNETAIRLSDDVTQTLNLTIDGTATTGGIHYENPNVGYQRWSTSNIERMRIDASGNLLVNTSTGITSVATKVQVEAAVNGEAGIGMRHSGSTAGKFMRMWTSSVNALYVQNNGNTGVVLTDGATAWTATSDENLKENISDIGPVLDTIKDFRCVNYSLKATESEAADKVGFIAQDWENTFPNVVDKDEDGTLSMKYTETIPVLLKAVQEQQAMIETLQAEVAALKGA